MQLSRLEARLRGKTTGGNSGRPRGTAVATVVGLHIRPGRDGCALRRAGSEHLQTVQRDSVYSTEQRTLH